jgi:phosphatidate phosphatase APP1
MRDRRGLRMRLPARLGRVVASLLPFFPQLAGAAEADAIVLYGAYGSNGSGVVEGRIVERKGSPEPTASDGRRTNLRRNLGLLINDERVGRGVRIGIGELAWDAVTDAEGYFRIDVSGLGALAPRWHPVRASSGEATAEGGLLLIPDGNVHGLISDLDDTILVSDVSHKRRMLARAFLENPLQREAVPGTARLYQSFAQRNPDPASAPVFYISGSPRQFYSAIQLFLRHNAYPAGVLITKRITDDETSEGLRDQVLYKMGKISEILARVPKVKFTLIGDDSESDPEIYAEVRRLHPDRVESIWIRHVSPDPQRERLEGQGDLDELLRVQR